MKYITLICSFCENESTFDESDRASPANSSEECQHCGAALNQANIQPINSPSLPNKSISQKDYFHACRESELSFDGNDLSILKAILHKEQDLVMSKAKAFSETVGQGSAEYAREFVKVEKLLKLGWMIDAEITRRRDRTRLANHLSGAA